MPDQVTILGTAINKNGTGGPTESGIGTVFPRHGVIVTSPPMHALQRDAFKEWLMAQRSLPDQKSPSNLKLEWEATESVDIFLMPNGTVVIRPELERLDLALSADEMLQNLCNIPKYKISFLSVQDQRVRQALRERGELWRISPLAAKTQQGTSLLFQSKVFICAEKIYYYNPHTGTRFITCSDFSGLKNLASTALANQLQEITQYSSRKNRHGNPEVAFFGADPLKFGSPNFFGLNFSALEPEALTSRYQQLLAQFTEATEPTLRGENTDDKNWQTQMSSVISLNRETQSDRLKDYGNIKWLPGGTFVNGEFHFANIEQSDKAPEVLELWDPLARGFITNFIREHSNIEYLNLGKITEDSTRAISGRQGVYLAEIKLRGELSHRVLILRLLRWGIRERLEEKEWDGQPKNLENAVFETEEYLDYTLDRRLGCLQLGMKLPPHVSMRRLTEEYTGSRKEFRGRFFPVIYFERDFINGVPTDKIPERKLAETRYALGVAKLLGQAAASNLIVGRCTEVQDSKPQTSNFDNGNELIIEGSNGLPIEITVSGHSGAFAAWRQPKLSDLAPAYANPVNKRVHLVPDPKAFALAYLEAMQTELNHIQSEYEKQRKAFDGLFKHLPRNELGNFAHRWDCVLKRLREADIDQIMRLIRRNITILEIET